MPNPKNGTVADNPEEAAKKFKGGSIHFKAEPKAPLIHQAVGKLSFKDDQLVQNVQTFIEAVQKKNILSVYISGTMTPSVQLEIA
jgi:large subunit ribosomal protein L1